MGHRRSDQAGSTRANALSSTCSHQTGSSGYLPVFGDGVPDSNPSGVAGGNQLVTNEEESLRWDVQAEDAFRQTTHLGKRPSSNFKCSKSDEASFATNFIPVAIRTDCPKNDLCHRGNSHHLIVVSQ